ncbi:MAG: acyl carrier protein [Paludibacteraceae bacterium]
MELTDFISKFASQFEDTDLSEFKAETEFKNLDEWSSLMSLSIIAMTDEEFDMKVKGEDIKNANTIEELYNIIKNRE